MSQLADRVRQIERLKAEKARNSRFQKKKEVNLVESFDDDYEDSDECLEYDESEVNVAELKPGPPYICKLLRPSNGKNPIEPKNDKFITKTYTFDITKCDEIFDLLVTDGQIVVPKDLKIPPIEQRKKRGYCKFHNYLGHKTYWSIKENGIMLSLIKGVGHTKRLIGASQLLRLLRFTKGWDPSDVQTIEHGSSEQMG
jgi:hypothetical protein